MTIAVIVVGVVVAALTAWWLLSHRSRPEPSITRDTPTVEADALGGGLSKTRIALRTRLSGWLSKGPAAESWEDLEDALLAADLGVAVTAVLVDRVRSASPTGPDEMRAALRNELFGIFGERDRSLHLEGSPAIVVVVGVNGSGKTTTIAKLGALLERSGSSALLGAADTFRAAAVEQLATWAEMLGLDLVSGQSGADPASVAFDALAAARARGKDVLVVDTAGRLHSKHNLMEELGKVVRVLEREAGAVDEVLLVLDGTSGQNALAQARVFTEVVGVTGLVISKLDGTARGGFAVAVEHELGIPVKYVGVGEGSDDLLPFEVQAFIDALLGG